MTLPAAAGAGDRRALLMDYGGVLTEPVQESFARYEAALGVRPGDSYAVLRAAAQDEEGGMIGALERGEVSVEEFDAHLQRLLRDAGYQVAEGTGLLEGLFAAMRPAGGLWGLVDEVRRAGVHTGLLSNSWGLSAYPFERLGRSFDTIVLSGEVGLRKPDARIFELAVDRVGLPAASCVFVDDLEPNVTAAIGFGLRGVHHRGDDHATRSAVLEALGLPLPPGGSGWGSGPPD